MGRLMRCCTCLLFPIVLTMGAGSAGAQERTIEFSLRECIDHALSENLNLKGYDLGLQYSNLGIDQATASFDPSLSMNVTRSKSASPNYTQYITVSSVEQQNTAMNIELGQELSTGGRWGLGLYSTLSESNIETAKNYTSNLGVQFSQPLLRGFGRDVTKANIYIARISSEQAAHNLEQQAINLVYDVERAYWNLVYARQTREVHEMSIEQADSLLAYNQKGLELGVMTESDVLEARSALVTRQQEALDQDNQIRSYEDQLRLLLNITSEAEWNMTIVPTDDPTLTVIDLDPQAALDLAFMNRPDHKLLKRQIEQQEISLMVAGDALKPNLDLSTQYRLNGSGETIGEHYKDLGNTDEYGWSVGLQFSYPIGNNAARADYERRQIDRKRSDLSLQDLESEIRTDIRSSIRAVDTARDQIDAARLSVEVNELKLRMEEERFRNQLSSSYYVLQFQRDLANSRNLLNRAMIDYMIAVIEFQRARGTILGDQNIRILQNDTN